MIGHLLSVEERLWAEKSRSGTPEKEAYVKLSVLIMLDEGMDHQVISTSLGISLRTVVNYKSKYNSEGLEGYLGTHYVPYRGRLGDEELSRLDTAVDNELFTTCAEVVEWVEREFGVTYSVSAIRAILGKLGFAYKKTTVVPGGLDVEEQKSFLKTFDPFLRTIDEETEVDLFMDGVHPQHNTRSDYAWIKKGTKKEIPSNTGRRRISLNGAMNANKPDEVVITEAQSINAQAVIQTFEALLEKYKDKQTINVFADNARYYTCILVKQWLEKNPKLNLFHIPPYSPNLNLIERLWKFMRKKVISLKYYEKYDDFRAAILGFFENIQQYKKELDSLMTHNFQRFSVGFRTPTANA